MRLGIHPSFNKARDTTCNAIVIFVADEPLSNSFIPYNFHCRFVLQYFSKYASVISDWLENPQTWDESHCFLSVLKGHCSMDRASPLHICREKPLHTSSLVFIHSSHLKNPSSVSNSLRHSSTLIQPKAKKTHKVFPLEHQLIHNNTSPSKKPKKCANSKESGTPAITSLGINSTIAKTSDPASHARSNGSMWCGGRRRVGPAKRARKRTPSGPLGEREVEIKDEQRGESGIR